MSIWDVVVAPLEHIIDKVLPDAAAKDAAKAQLEQLKESDYAKQVEEDVRVQLAGLDVVKTEAEGESWLQRNWRPLSALTFVALLVAYWFGLNTPHLSEASIADMFAVVKLCLGGYTMGRTVEKVAPSIAAAFKK